METGIRPREKNKQTSAIILNQSVLFIAYNVCKYRHRWDRWEVSKVATTFAGLVHIYIIHAMYILTIRNSSLAEEASMYRNPEYHT